MSQIYYVLQIVDDVQIFLNRFVMEQEDVRGEIKSDQFVVFVVTRDTK